MIDPESKIDQICFYINQMQMLLFSQEEQKQMKKIIDLYECLQKENFNSLSEDLQFKSWLTKTISLINKYKERLHKNEIINQHIKQCYDFIVYKLLKEKLNSTTSLEFLYSLQEWNFYEIDNDNSHKKWFSSKLLQYFELSSVKSELISISKNQPLLITNDWLNTHQNIFYTPSLFVGLNTSLPIST